MSFPALMRPAALIATPLRLMAASCRNREIEYVFARIFNGELVHTRVRFRAKVHKWLGPHLAALTGRGEQAISAFFRLIPEIFIMGEVKQNAFALAQNSCRQLGAVAHCGRIGIWTK